MAKQSKEDFIDGLHAMWTNLVIRKEKGDKPFAVCLKVRDNSFNEQTLRRNRGFSYDEFERFATRPEAEKFMAEFIAKRTAQREARAAR